MPRIPAYALDREFSIDQVNEEVTSIDISPHGGFCIVGCSNGAVLLFDLTNTTSQRNGYLLTHIISKGMHTRLIVTVKISDDSRFCFVGVRKGSSDLIAIDLTTYPLNWAAFPSFNGYVKARKQAVIQNGQSDLHLPLFDIYRNNDPKLRGFGTATAVPLPAQTEGNSYPTGSGRFWIACGMGIKNVHLWQLVITPPSPT
ncbi:hypothetical protein EON65_28115, partial [archaeon]